MASLPNFSEMDWNELGARVNSLPPAWMPRRDQPEWDRDFTGRADIQAAFSHKTDKARTWAVEAVAFSEILKDGFREDGDTDDTRLIEFGAAARKIVAKGKNQGLDA